MENKMFCFQCQETAGCKGCTQVGVCGKKPEVAAMQDLLIYVTKGLSAVTTRLRAEGKPVSREVNHLDGEPLHHDHECELRPRGHHQGHRDDAHGQGRVPGKAREPREPAGSSALQ